jgi:UDP-glucose 4-epimerase
VHFAARSLVAESVERPRLYFEQNVGGTLALLDGMRRAGVTCIVFSSSAAVYGNRDLPLLDESLPLAPEHPYGLSKAMMESLLREACAEGFAAIALRYFNAAGAHGARGEDHRPESHLVPRLCAHLLGRLPDLAIHGSDYPTPDGTAIRDYVHVYDLARAHALALEALRPGELRVVNLGSGQGQSVREIVEAAARISGRPLSPQPGPRRAGDPARLVASNARAAELLGWRPQISTPQRILADAWQWHADHPDGYAD